MNAAIHDGVIATLHEDRAGNEWIILTSLDYPGAEEEITPDDRILFGMLKDKIKEALA